MKIINYTVIFYAYTTMTIKLKPSKPYNAHMRP